MDGFIVIENQELNFIPEKHIFGDYLIEFEYNNDRIIVFLNRSTDFVTDFR